VKRDFGCAWGEVGKEGLTLFASFCRSRATGGTPVVPVGEATGKMPVVPANGQECPFYGGAAA